MSRLGDIAVVALTLVWPAFGSPRADMTLDGGTPPAVGARATLTVGDLTMTGTVTISAEELPARPRVVLVGGAGWDRLVATPLSYQSDAGVRLKSVLAELAARAGETIEQPGDVSVGGYYECIASRPYEPVRLRDALAELVRAGSVQPWRVDPDGVTRFGARASAEVSVARATRISRDVSAGLRVIGIDAPLAFLPGNTLDGEPIGRLIVVETSGKLVAELWSPGPLELPVRVMSDRPRTYVVANVRGDKRLDLVPPTDAPHLPEIAACEQWTLGGSQVTPTVGAEVLVAFRDERRSRPVVVAFESSSVPDEVTIAGGGPAVARVGDIAGTLMWEPSPPTLYYSPGPLSPYVAVTVNPNSPTPPTTSTPLLLPGTDVEIATGSDRAGCG